MPKVRTMETEAITAPPTTHLRNNSTSLPYPTSTLASSMTTLESAVSETTSDVDAGVTPSSFQSRWPRGHRPYFCLFGCFLLMANSWGLVNAYGTFASYYKQTLLPDADYLIINLIGAAQSAIVLVLSIFTGRLLDAGHASLLIGTGAGLVTLGMFLLSIVNGDAGFGEGSAGLIFVTQGVLVGLGMACFFVSSSQVAATWFVHVKAIAIGIVACGASIAGLIYPLVLRYMIAAVGFNNAVRVVAGLVGFTSLLAWITVRPNPDHPIRKPEKWARFSVWIDWSAFKHAPFVWFSMGICFMFFGFYAVFFNIEEWAAVQGIAAKATPDMSTDGPHQDLIYTFWLLCLMNGCSTFGRVGAACFSERFGTLNVHAAVTFVSSILVLCLWTTAESLATALVFVCLYGAVSGAVIGLPPASMASILGRSDLTQQAKLGQWTGMMYSMAGIFALVGPVVGGHLLSEYGTYLTIQIWSGLCLFVSAVCMLVARFYAGNQQGHEQRSLRQSLSEKLSLRASGGGSESDTRTTSVTTLSSTK